MLVYMLFSSCFIINTMVKYVFMYNSSLFGEFFCLLSVFQGDTPTLEKCFKFKKKKK